VSVFRVGLNAARAEFRSTDIAGRPVDAVHELPTARTERIEQLQERWQPRGVPSSDPRDVMVEWLRNPVNRMSAFAMRLGEQPDLMPDAEIEPGPGQRPQPGGLIERIASQREASMATARRMAGQLGRGLAHVPPLHLPRRLARPGPAATVRGPRGQPASAVPARAPRDQAARDPVPGPGAGPHAGRSGEVQAP
jgi:hypothetical protein